MDNKEPTYNALTLDLPSAPKALVKVNTILIHIWGTTGGVPLAFVIWHNLSSPEIKEDDSPFRKELGTLKYNLYNSIDQETSACIPILTNEAMYGKEYETLKTSGPFVPAFSNDWKKVSAILVALFSSAGAWQHVYNFSTQQNGRQVWNNLHNHFFGDDNINIPCTDILSTLNFKSQVPVLHRRQQELSAHDEQHNHNAALVEYTIAPLADSM